jgi:hypothetical protein
MCKFKIVDYDKKEVMLYHKEIQRSMNIIVDDLLLFTIGFQDWIKGKLIQNALSNLLPEEREFIISGIYPEEWKAMFPEEENEYE